MCFLCLWYAFKNEANAHRQKYGVLVPEQRVSGVCVCVTAFPRLISLPMFEIAICPREDNIFLHRERVQPQCYQTADLVSWLEQWLSSPAPSSGLPVYHHYHQYHHYYYHHHRRHHHY